MMWILLCRGRYRDDILKQLQRENRIVSKWTCPSRKCIYRSLHLHDVSHSHSQLLFRRDMHMFATYSAAQMQTIDPNMSFHLQLRTPHHQNNPSPKPPVSLQIHHQQLHPPCSANTRNPLQPRGPQGTSRLRLGHGAPAPQRLVLAAPPPRPPLALLAAQRVGRPAAARQHFRTQTMRAQVSTRLSADRHCSAAQLSEGRREDEGVGEEGEGASSELQ